MQTKLINFVIPVELLAEFDQLAKVVRSGRSELLREAVRRYIREERERDRDFITIAASAKARNLTEQEALKLVDSTRKELPMNQ